MGFFAGRCWLGSEACWLWGEAIAYVFGLFLRVAFGGRGFDCFGVCGVWRSFFDFLVGMVFFWGKFLASGG